MPIIQLPDNSITQFPDDMSEAEINSAIEKHLEGPPTLGIAKTAYAPFKPIVENTFENLKNAVTNTGEAISEPLNNPQAPNGLQTIDAGIRTLGKAGNVIGGTAQAAFSPVTGALAASVEPMLPYISQLIKEHLLSNDSRFHVLSPEEAHVPAMSIGNDLGTAVGLGMAANSPIARNRAGLLPAKVLTDPLQPIYDKLKDMSNNTSPRAGFIASNSSDPMAPPTPTIPDASEMRAQASQKLGQADLTGGMLKPVIPNSWADNALKILPQSQEAKTVFGQESPIAKMIERIQNLRDKPMSLQGTLEIDKGLGDLAHENVDPKTGIVTAEGNKYLQLQRSLRDLWENASPNDTIGGKAGFDLAKEGRNMWAAAARMNDVERIVNRANMTTNPAQAIKSGMTNFMSNPVRTRGWNAEELAAGHRAAKTGIVSGAIKLGSNRFVAPMVGATIGGPIGGPIGAGIGSGVAEGANVILNARQNARANNLLNILASRAERP